MIATNYSQVRDNLKCYMDKVTEDYEPVIITRKNDKNVVMISEEAYNNMLENMHLMGNKANYDWLIESKRQFENGNVKIHEISEAEDE